MAVTTHTKQWEISIYKEDIQNIIYEWMCKNSFINQNNVSPSDLKFDFTHVNVLPLEVTVKL